MNMLVNYKKERANMDFPKARAFRLWSSRKGVITGHT
jgi:hypothetical protein